MLVLVACPKKVPAHAGMNFLAGMLLLYLTEESAFWTLADIVEKYLENYFLESMLGVVVDQLVCRELIRRHFPLVSEHAEVLQVDLGLVTTQWCGINNFCWSVLFAVQDTALLNNITPKHSSQAPQACFRNRAMSSAGARCVLG